MIKYLQAVFRGQLLIVFIFLCAQIQGQNSIVGDGFGGRLWYKPTNVSCAPYGAFTTCNGEMFGWGIKYNTYKLVGDYVNYFQPRKVQNIGKVKYHSAGYVMTVIRDNDSGYVWEVFSSRNPTAVADNIKFCDGGWRIGAFVKKDGTVLLAADNNNIISNFEKNWQKEIGTLNNSFFLQDVKGIANAVRCAVGVNSVYILTDKGQVYVLSYQEQTHIGLGDTLTVNRPTLIPNLKDIVDIKATTYGTIALDKYGAIYLWNKVVKRPQKYFFRDVVAISGQCDGWMALALTATGNCYKIDLQKNSSPIFVDSNVIDIIAGEDFFYTYSKDSAFRFYSVDNHDLTSNKGSVRIGVDFSIAMPCVYNRPTENYIICKGDSLSIYSNTLYTEGFHDVLYKDTLRSIYLGVKDTLSKYDRYQYCNSDNQYFIKIDTSIDFSNQKVCKTIYTISENLPSYHIFDTLYGCNGIPVEYRNRWVSRDTHFINSFKTVRGCDSIITGVAIFNNKVLEEFTKVKCIGDDFTFLKKTYSLPGIFFDTIKGFRGCDSIIFKFTLIENNCGITVFIPSAFTPNQEGPKENNVFMPFLDNYASFLLRIFNRWGEKLYETSDYTQGWTGNYMGEPAQDGVYVYVLEVISKSNKTYTYSGTVTLLR
jgi:gliding motility-associated-like protein